MLRSLTAIGVVLGLVCHPALADTRKEIRLQQGTQTTLEGVVSQSSHPYNTTARVEAIFRKIQK